MEQFRRQVIKPFALASTPQVPGYGPSGPVNIAFLGEAPGAEEVAKGQPFVGPAGEFMEKGPCTTAKVWFRGSWLTNVIDRQPPTWNGKNNAINSPDAIECIEAQTDELWRELEWLVRSKHIKVLVALGGTATLALGIKEPITKVRGSVYEISLSKRRALTREELDAGEAADVVCVATLHPSGLKRNLWTKRSSGTMEDTSAVTDDLKKVQRLVENGYKRPVENFILRPTADEIVAWIDEVLLTNTLVAVDTESKGDINLEPAKRQLTIVGLARNETDAISISFLEEDGLQTWTNGSLDRIVTALNLLFTAGRLMMQNAMHDVPLIAATPGFEINPACIEDDTLLLHHAVDPETKHNLGYIVSRFGLTTYWKEDVEKKAFGKVYNCRDCVVLPQVRTPLIAAAQKIDPTGAILEVYRNETMALLPSIIAMHQRGMGLDRRRLKMWQQFIASKLQAVEEHLRTVADVHPSFNFKSEHDTQALFFGVFPEEKLRQAKIVGLKTFEDLRKENDAKIAEVEAEIAKCEASGRVTTKKYATLKERRLKLDDWQPTKLWTDARETLDRYRTLTQMWPGINKWNGRKTKSKDRASLSKKTYPEMLNFAFKRQEELQGLVRPTLEHEAEKAQLQRFVSVTSTYGTYSRVSHIVGTYGDYETWSDGRVHGTLLLQGTATGRLSMKDPNLMNIPKREAWAQQVRRVFVPREGYVYLEFDYSNIEFVILAYVTGEQAFIDVVLNGQNIHDLNTPILFADQGITDDSHPLWKAGRRAAKAFQFGGVQYGGGDMEVHRNIIADAPELGLTMAQYKRAKARYLGTYKELDAWQQHVKLIAIGDKARNIKGKRKSVTPFGRVRLLNGNDKDIEKQALNTPIQGGAAHVINRAQIRVERALRDAGLASCETILQIHDQLIFECPIELVAKAAPIIIAEMERPFPLTDWRGVTRTVTPKVDPEFGLDMYDTAAIPLVDGQVDEAAFQAALADLRSKPVAFTDDIVATVDDDTFEGDEDDTETDA